MCAIVLDQRVINFSGIYPPFPFFSFSSYSLTETIGRRSAGGNSSRRKGESEEGEAGDQHDSFCEW